MKARTVAGFSAYLVFAFTFDIFVCACYDARTFSQELKAFGGACMDAYNGFWEVAR